MPDPNTEAAADVAAAIRNSVSTVEASEPNPFGDIGHPTQIRDAQLREFGLDKAKAIADTIDKAIADGDTSTITEIVKAVGGVASSFIPAPILTALGSIPGIAARLSA